MQANNRYVAFFRKDSGFLRIILEIKNQKLQIVTFMNTENIPDLDEIDNTETNNRYSPEAFEW